MIEANKLREPCESHSHVECQGLNEQAKTD